MVDAELALRLSSAGAVLVEGARACGKTETSRRQAASEVLLDVDAGARRALSIEPSLVLDGPAPRLIDEWQLEAPVVWSHVRRLVDDRGEPGQFILTGSAVPEAESSRHSGAGRFSILRMRPMSLFESGHSTGRVSLSDLMEGSPPVSPDPGTSVADLAERVTVGGWPANLELTPEVAAQAARDYLRQIREVDVARALGGNRDPLRMGRLLASLGRNVATEVSISVLAADAGSEGGELSRHTVYDYLDVLDRLMVTEDLPAWSTHMRSRATLRNAPKRHFVDPSLAVAAIGASPTRLLSDLNYLGLLYESLVIRDLRVLAQPLGGTVYHYRDSYGVEIDAIVALDDGRWGAFEMKLGTGLVEEGALALQRFAAQVDMSKAGPPAVLAVICGTGYGYVRPDGISVVPCSALGP